MYSTGLCFAAVLDRLAPAAARIVRDLFQTARSEDFTVHVGDWRQCAILLPVLIYSVELQHLHFETLGQPSSFGHGSFAPDERA